MGGLAAEKGDGGEKGGDGEGGFHGVFKLDGFGRVLFAEALVAHVGAELVPGGPEGDEDAGEAGHREEEDADGVGRHGDDDTPRVVF